MIEKTILGSPAGNIDMDKDIKSKEQILQRRKENVRIFKDVLWRQS